MSLNKSFFGPSSIFILTAFVPRTGHWSGSQSEDIIMAPEFPVASCVTLDKSPSSSVNQEIGPQIPTALPAETSQHKESM